MNKGSRQIRSVPLEKGLALMIALRRVIFCRVDESYFLIDSKGLIRGFRLVYFVDFTREFEFRFKFSSP